MVRISSYRLNCLAQLCSMVRILSYRLNCLAQLCSMVRILRYRWNCLAQLCAMIRVFELQCCGTHKTFLVLLIQLAIDLRMKMLMGLASEASCSNSTNTLAPQTHWPLLACAVEWAVGAGQAGSAQLCAMFRILRYQWNSLAQVCSMIRIFKLQCCGTDKTFHIGGICRHK